MDVAPDKRMPPVTVIVTTSYPAHGDDPSGHFVAAEARALARRGPVTVIAGGGDRPRVESRDGVEVRWLGCGELFAWPGAAARLRQRWWRAPDVLHFTRRARSALRASHPSLVVAHWLLPSVWPALLGTSVPVEGRAHGADVRLLLGLPAPARTRLVTWLVRRCRRIRFAAASSLDALASALPAPLAHRLAAVSEVSPSPIDLPPLDDRATLRRRLGWGDDERVAIAVGRLVPSKRFHLAAHAGVGRLVIVGDGPEEARLRAIGGVELVGLRPRAETLALIRAADVLVHPSEHEAAPTVIREARALGVPVVACAAGDVASWAATDPGIVLADPTPDALRRAMHVAVKR